MAIIDDYAPLTEEQERYVLAETACSVKSLLTILKEIDRTPHNHYKSMRCNETYSQEYACAKAEQQDLTVEFINDVAEEAKRKTTDGLIDGKSAANYVNACKLQIDGIKWVAARLKAKKYGDKLDLNHSGDITTNIIRLPAKSKKPTKEDK